MKRIILVSLAVLVVSGLAMGQTSLMQGSLHDLGSGGGTTLSATNVDKICVFCHTPHQATAANGQDPLWNHTLSATASYGVYASDTLDANMTGADIGGATVGTASVSNLCMSCHDGTVGVGSLYNDPNEAVPDNSAAQITSTANLGADLTDEHPINFTYDGALATADGELVTPASSDWVDTDDQVPLFGGTLQCASCHDPHNTVADPFLVRDNTDSALCAECHTK